MTFLDQAAEQLPDEFHDGWLAEHAADADEFYRELAQWHDAHGEEAYQCGLGSGLGLAGLGSEWWV